MNDKLNELAAKVYKAHRAAFDFVLENRPDPASTLYPYFETEIKSRGFQIGSRNKGYVRFTSPHLAATLPKLGRGWPDKESFLFEIDYFWSDKRAVGKAMVAPGDDSVRKKILAAAPKYPNYRDPEGQQWSAFYKDRTAFVASEVSNDDEESIKRKVKNVVDAFAKEAANIFTVLQNGLSERP